MKRFNKYTVLVLAALAAAPVAVHAQDSDPDTTDFGCDPGNYSGTVLRADGSIVKWKIPHYIKNELGERVANDGSTYGARHIYSNERQVDVVFTGAGTKNAHATRSENGHQTDFTGTEDSQLASNYIHKQYARCKRTNPQPSATMVAPLQLHPDK